MQVLEIRAAMAIIEQLIARNSPQAGYEKRVKDTNFWRALALHNEPGFAELVTQYRTRETDEQKEQRVRLTQNPCPALIHQATSHIERIYSPEGRNNQFKYEQEREAEKALLEGRIAKFKGDTDALSYLIETVKDALCWGPNDYLLLMFDFQRKSTGALIERPHPISIHVPAKDVYDVGNWSDGTSKYLCTLRHFMPTEKKKDEYEKMLGLGKKGNDDTWKVYTLYAAGLTVEAVQINGANPIEEPVGASMGKTVYPSISRPTGEKEDTTYQITVYISKSKEAPFAALGMSENRETGGCYSFLEDCRAELLDALNDKSQYAVTKATHAFPRLVQYANKCEHREKDKGRCENGTMSTSRTNCDNCKGTGRIMIGGPQDTLLMPVDAGEAALPAIQNMMHFFTPPFDIVSHMKGEVEEATHTIMSILWGTDLRQTHQPAAATATEVISRYDMVYRRLSAIEKHIGNIWCKVVRLTAQYAEIDEGLIVSYEAREDFQMESLKELLEALALSKTSGAPLAIIYNLEDRIMKKMRSSEKDMAWHRVLRAWKPFSEKAPDEIAMTMEIMDDDSYLKTLSIFYTDIMNDIRREVPTFVLMNYRQQEETIVQYTDQYKTMLRKPLAVSSGQLFGEPA